MDRKSVLRTMVSALLIFTMVLSIFPIVNADVSKPIVVLKLDDLGSGTWQAFKSTKDILDEKGVTGSFGIIGKNSDGNYPELFDFINECIAGGIEIWSHGYTHSKPAMGVAGDNGEAAWSKEEIRADFKKTLDMLKEKCGYTIKTFGAPNNTIGKTVYELLQEEFTQIQTVMLNQDKSGTWEGTALTNRCNIETLEQVGVVVPLNDFKRNYESFKDAKYIVLQGHPSIWRTNDEKAGNTNNVDKFKAIIDFLKEEGCEFKTPSQVTELLRQEEMLIQDNGLDVADFYYTRDGEKMNVLSPGEVTAAVAFYPTAEDTVYDMILAAYSGDIMTDIKIKTVRPFFESVKTYNQQAKSGAVEVASYQVPVCNTVYSSINADSKVTKIQCFLWRRSIKPGTPRLLTLSEKSNDNIIRDFSVTIDGKEYSGDINEKTNSISVRVPTQAVLDTGAAGETDYLVRKSVFAAAVKNLTPQIDLPAGASFSLSSHDFTAPQKIAVTAANGDTREYIVSVEETIFIRSEEFSGGAIGGEAASSINLSNNPHKGFNRNTWTINTTGDNVYNYASDPVTGNGTVLKVQRISGNSPGEGIEYKKDGISNLRIKSWISDVEFCITEHTTSAYLQFRMSPDTTDADTLMIRKESEKLIMYNRPYNTGSRLLQDPLYSKKNVGKLPYSGNPQKICELDYGRWYKLKGVYTQGSDYSARQIDYYLDGKLVYSNQYDWHIRNFTLPHVFNMSCDKASRWTVYLKNFSSSYQVW